MGLRCFFRGRGESRELGHWARYRGAGWARGCSPRRQRSAGPRPAEPRGGSRAGCVSRRVKRARHRGAGTAAGWETVGARLRDRLELADTSCKQAGRHVLGRGQWRGARGTGGAGLTSGTSWHRAGRSSRRAEALGPAAAPPGQLPGRPPWALQLRRGGREATTQMLSPGLYPAALGMSHLLDRSSIWGFEELGTCALGPLTTAGHAPSWAASKPSRGPALPLQL